MKTVKEIKKDILKLDENWDADDIICAFGDFEEEGIDEVIVEKSYNAGYDYIAYINAVESSQFCICVDKNNKIIDVWIA